MPVRIYDIAKKLGIESKDVLAKAKALGITGAKVPSSSLDKITAEYLEEQMGGGKAVAVAEPSPPAPEPVVIVSAPPEPPPPAPLPEVSVSLLVIQPLAPPLAEAAAVIEADTTPAIA